jgi:periplasmic protein TonB
VATAPSAPQIREPASTARTAPAPAASPVVEVTAITSRDDFLLELGETLAGQAAVRPVETIEAALPYLAAKKRGQILVIDARGVEELRAAAERAHREAAHAVLLVFGEASAEAQTAAALKGSKVFALLPLPVDPRKTQAVFEGAVAEAQQRLGAGAVRGAPPTPAPNLSIGAFRPGAAPAEARSDDGGSPGSSKLLFVAVAIAAVAAAGGAWYFLSGKQSHQAPAPAPEAAVVEQPAQPASTPAAPAPAAAAAAAEDTVPVADTSLVKGKVDELLEKARLAMHERRYSEPTGDNALLYYRSAAAADASNAEARDGLQRVAGVLAGRFDDALSAGRFDEAALTLASLRLAAPADPRVASAAQHLAVAQFGKAMSDGNYDRAALLVQRAQQSGTVPAEQIARWRADLARHQEDARVQHLAGLVEDRIRDGRLDDADDSARSYVQQLTAVAAANPATQRVTHDLIAAYLRKAQQAAAARNGAEQDRWLNDARAAGMKPTELAAFQRDLASSRAKAAQAESERLLGLAHDRMTSGALTDPPQDSAAYYLTQLQTSAPGDAGLAQASRDLAARLVDRARAAISAGRSGDADLAAARRWGADPAALAAAQQLASAPKAQPPAANTAALATKLKQTRFANPEYPQTALNNRISGAVTLTYTVDTSGAPRDVRVVEASPPGVFDNAAVSAVKRWRYAPMVVSGAAVEVPVRTRVLFELPKQ